MTNPEGFTEELKAICEKRCAETAGEPPCWKLPELTEPCEHIKPCADCLAEAAQEVGEMNLPLEPVTDAYVSEITVQCGMCGHGIQFDFEALEDGRVNPAHDFQECPNCKTLCDAQNVRFSASVEATT